MSDIKSNDKKDSIEEKASKPEKAQGEEITQKIEEQKQENDKSESSEQNAQKSQEELELEAELESIKDLMQTQVDKLLENPETSDWNELVKTASREIKESKQAKTQVDLCEVCGENPKDKTVFEGNPYCTQCRELLKKHPYKFTEFIMPVLVVLLLFLSSWQLAMDWGIFKSVAGAQSLVRQKKLYSAMEAYDDVNVQIKVNNKALSKKILSNQIMIYNKAGVEYYESIESFVNKYFSGENLNLPSNRTIKKVMNDIDDFNKVYELAGESFQSAKDYKSFVKSFDKAIKDDEKIKYDESLVEYWKYYAAFAFDEKNEIQLKHLKNMEKISTRYSSLYLPNLAQLALAMKDYENVYKYCDAMESNNLENIDAKAYKATAYRLQKDFANSKSVIKEGLKIDKTESQMNHQMAILLLLDGKPKEAKLYAKTAYENAKMQHTFILSGNLYALCAHLDGDSQTYTELEEELGEQFSKDVVSIVEGSKSVEDVFLKGEGDLSWK